MIETRRAQRTFGDGLITDEVKDLHEDWMKHADQVLADKEIVAAVRCPLDLLFNPLLNRG